MKWAHCELYLCSCVWDSELVGSGAGWVSSVGPGTIGRRNRDDMSEVGLCGFVSLKLVRILGIVSIMGRPHSTNV